ncbi:hypothetical protein MSG28_001971 [Choristoneura fumiferana]|uniref:Uncharacterized protein n=1 Tax=Choristoneura fumiferana TaxID=7141 RepID=A0ACC0JTP1_CHOFU|nr:hypothetical protein MSG28_001971 [Choristoneura fumiferana]
MPLLGVVLEHAAALTRPDVLQFDGEMGQFNNFYNTSSNDPDNKQSGRPPFNSETHRNLLMCLVWLLKSCSRAALAACCADLPPARLHALLHVIHLCFAAHEYKVPP